MTAKARIWNSIKGNQEGLCSLGTRDKSVKEPTANVGNFGRNINSSGLHLIPDAGNDLLISCRPVKNVAPEIIFGRQALGETKEARFPDEVLGKSNLRINWHSKATYVDSPNNLDLKALLCLEKG